MHKFLTLISGSESAAARAAAILRELRSSRAKSRDALAFAAFAAILTADAILAAAALGGAL